MAEPEVAEMVAVPALRSTAEKVAMAVPVASVAVAAPVSEPALAAQVIAVDGSATLLASWTTAVMVTVLLPSPSVALLVLTSTLAAEDEPPPPPMNGVPASPPPPPQPTRATVTSVASHELNFTKLIEALPLGRCADLPELSAPGRVRSRSSA
ncbi:hypothetical protein PEC18_29795 [Paucibacter sp. O1-1]|nr:hypothetical protein [Paucibacter sp. O1-1]MDA3829928.1 hypothetical protein [Paucibacter sp. O1-1]